MKKIRILLSLFSSVLLLLFTASSLSPEEAWTPVKKAGFTFSCPPGWHFLDLGSQAFVKDGCIGHSLAAGSPEGAGTVTVVFFPDFSLSLSEAKTDFRGFLKMNLENFMLQQGIKNTSWQESSARFFSGEANGFLATEKTGDKVFKAAAIYGSLRGKNAAVVIITFSITDSESGVKYIGLTEKILGSLTFPQAY
ncbi:MAG: hypothetical protein EHM28_03150 [Spirochaetaceae bacterium]|nr:MAG: hypothetical protein EHM28_03150 [Spirochaetaceae bacterium]